MCYNKSTYLALQDVRVIALLVSESQQIITYLCQWYIVPYGIFRSLIQTQILHHSLLLYSNIKINKHYNGNLGITESIIPLSA